MNIESIKIYQYNLPLVSSTVWHRKSHTYRKGILIQIKGAGKEGWGDIAPLPGFSHESLAESRTQAISLAGSIQNSPNDLFDTTVLKAYPSVQFGFELAWHNLNKSSRDESTHKLLPVACCKLLNRQNHGDFFSINSRAIHDYRAVKIKVGRRNLSEDLEFVHRICEENPELEIRIDVNRRWSLKMAQEFLYNTRNLTLGYIEEPLNDKTKLADFARSSHIPLALDETLREPESERYRPLSNVYVLKPTLSGGIFTLTQEISQAKSKGIRCIISSSYESGIGMLGLIELARTIPDEIHGLDTYQVFKCDVFKELLPLNGPVLYSGERLVNASNLNMAAMEEIVEYRIAG